MSVVGSAPRKPHIPSHSHSTSLGNKISSHNLLLSIYKGTIGATSDFDVMATWVFTS